MKYNKLFDNKNISDKLFFKNSLRAREKLRGERWEEDRCLSYNSRSSRPEFARGVCHMVALQN